MSTLRIGSLAMLLVSTAHAGPSELQVHPLLSTADVELCMTFNTTACDTDRSPVAGRVTVAFDCPTSPSAIRIHDFILLLTNDITLDLDFGFTGTFETTGTNLGFSYAHPGDPLPLTPLRAGTFEYTGVPGVAEGMLEYRATGTVCLILNLGGYLCDDVIDLSTIILDPIDMTGTTFIDGDELTVTLNVGVSGPVGGGLGTLNAEATVVAMGSMPTSDVPGDLTGDDLVNLEDFPYFVDCLLGPEVIATDACECADLTTDNDTDLEDFAEFQIEFRD